MVEVSEVLIQRARVLVETARGVTHQKPCTGGADKGAACVVCDLEHATADLARELRAGGHMPA